MKRLFVALCAAGLAACGSSSEPEPDGALGQGRIETLADDVAPVVEARRSLRRMNVDQLSESIARVTGERWQELDAEGATVDLFDRLSGSLGKPDYLDSTEEDLTPGLLFQKFLGDAAALTCDAMLAAEPARGPSERLLLVASDPDVAPSEQRSAAMVDLKGALLRFHGRRAADDDAELAVWWWLLDESATETGSPLDGWRTVCVGLITHPDFYSF